MEFQGDTPYVLVVSTLGATHAIDLDEPGWMEKHAALLRVPSQWILARKDNTPVLTMFVADGETPSYLSRVIGTASLPPPDVVGIDGEAMRAVRERAEVRAYSIGKHQPDGVDRRMWILPSGTVCMDDDVYALGAEMAKNRLFAMLRSARNGNDQEDGQEGSRTGRRGRRPQERKRPPGWYGNRRAQQRPTP